MSRIFGSPRQIGYVVDDMDGAIDRWLKLGIGPFYRFDALKTNFFRVRGQDVPLNLNTAMAFSGDMQIELIHQTDDTPTPYRDFLKRYGPGMHHLAYWTDTYDADTRRYNEAGFNPVIEGEVAIEGANGIRFSYLEPGYESETLIEVVEVTDVSSNLNKLILDASIGWDGSDPIRRL